MDLFKVTVGDDGEIKAEVVQSKIGKMVKTSTSKNADGTVKMVLSIDGNAIRREVQSAVAEVEKQAKAKAAKSKQE